MISSQEKAKELVDKFKPFVYCYMGSGMLTNEYDEDVANKYAKECALIAVDEIINSEPAEPYDGRYYELISDRQDEVSKYWHYVKEAITNL